jgi:hypothetical protein
VGGRPSARSPLAVTAQLCIPDGFLRIRRRVNREGAGFPRSPISRVSPPNPPDQARRQSEDGFFLLAARRNPFARQKKYLARCPHQARYFHSFNPVDPEPMFQNTTQREERLETNE